MEAVVCASHGAMGSLLWKLGALLSDEYRLLTKVKADVMFLKDVLESMHAFLKRMSEVEDPDEQSKCWMKEVRELSYDIEDSINSFMFSLGCESSSKPGGFKGFVGRCLSLFTDAKTRHWNAKKIQCLKVHVVEASNRRQRYKVEDAFPRPCRISIDPRLPAFYTETTRLVGIDGPRDKLIKLLTEGHGTMAQLNVVSIVGFGGLGMATLANEVYRKLEGQFDYKASVSVSQKPDMKKILRNILCQHSCREFGNSEAWDEQQLINTIRQFLKDKRYAAYLFVTILFSTNFDVPINFELHQHMFNLCKFVMGTLL